MITLTKEWLLKTIAELEADRDAVPGVVNEDAARALEAMKIALASLEADVVAWTDEQELRDVEKYGCGYLFTANPITPNADPHRVIKLYTAPPVPVSVPDEATPDNIQILASTFAPCGVTYQWDRDECNAAADSWNACRAAMLQGAEPVSNRDELPDGWVACSERMPDIGTEIFYFCQNDGLRDCGIVSSSNFSGKGDAELYVHAEGYDLRFGVDISHWMPLPAAPQQEVK
ncbi:DUF551 domain-containing protein [Enterobacter hormaechei subsp. steigerwaltii]|uniref:DUF551 domain-containing protein n=1 Tax=Enterobacter hormaechei TaxID=158836 RepID=UPI001E461098|nr:DUF551 domain-containing protein [Enterobacter hormaechei]MCC9378921.1 DUF551 domain-containing protein [Enterobacter hormaechei subsp. steigerwaltii]MCC9392852.1 DUF551 domain-containing protein [Enterobacter hormaechei subsp. steigerwaltii]MCC9419331.1 DUF551 domain-containing protein [Enterobacter hormaechei subsp. steigerwaltii]MCD0214442.1 DUF551 domain-containing protein [Enterobacter hormaechei subsp. steigerwaltii]